MEIKEILSKYSKDEAEKLIDQSYFSLTKHIEYENDMEKNYV